MSSLTIKDENDKTLVNIDLAGKSLEKYLRSAVSLRSLVSASALLSSRLGDHDGSRSLALVLDTDVPVGRNAELALNAGASAGIGIHPAGSELFDDGDLLAPETVANGTSYASLRLEAVLGAALGAQAGRISFGFSGGTSIRYGYCHPFDVVGPSPSIKEAVERLLAAAVFPADLDDLARLPAGSFATIAGEGELTVTGTAGLSATTNLLAAPSLPLVGTVASLTQAGSVSVEASWTLKGGFEMRLAKLDAARVRLSFFRRRGRSLAISARALAGVAAPVRGRDMIAMLMTAISANPEVDLIALVDAGLDDATIEAIQGAVAASVDRSLTIAAQLELSSRKEGDALFSYEIDLSRLDQTASAAVVEALHGRLAPIEAAAAQGAPIRVVLSAASSLEARKTAWRINLLGILNVASFVELARQGQFTFDHLTGSLTAADQISARRIRIVSAPLESDARKLREVLFESLMVTTAYQASRVLGSTISLTVEQSYLEQRDRTREADLVEHYRSLVALGLCTAEERDERLREAQSLDLGRSTFFVRNRFDPKACDALFLDAAGAPWPVERYEAIARRAFVTLLSSADPNQAFRRPLLEADTAWAQARLLGDDLRRLLPAAVRHDGRKLGLVTGDVITILWWAKAMQRAASELARMRAFIGDRSGPELAADSEFRKRKDELADRLKGMAAETGARFDLPWDVLAMDDAAARLGTLEAAIVSEPLTVRYAESDPVETAPAAARTRARAAARGAERGRAESRPWSPAEIDVFSRHVINLRKGKLSTGGGFSSSEEQVRQIFAEHIPAYAAAQRRRGQPARVMFFAHGGLTEEIDGLRGVLTRQRFWSLNGIYPVYFVWETGLFETLLDIVGLPARTRDRGAVADAAIELAARRGGRLVWGQMKKSAEAAAGSGGGSRLVAGLAAEMAGQLGGEVEFHALGHSAGAIFQAHFLPLLVQPRAGGAAVSVRTLHLLAPAITIDLFKQTLKPLVGSGQPISSLVTYTMTDELEQADNTVRPYGKSLLYLVSGAFEDAVPTQLLGMQRGLRQDVQLIRFFGLAGTEKVADICFSKTDPAAPKRSRTESATHGGFDNDVATMTSIVRRVLEVPDSAAVVDYFEDEIPGFERAAVGVPPATERADRGAAGTTRGGSARKPPQRSDRKATRKTARKR